MNCLCDRCITKPARNIEIGMVTSATNANVGDVEHHPHYEDHRQQRCEQLAHRLLERLGHVVDVVGHPAEQLAALAVEVAERQPVELVLDVRTHPVDRPLDNIVEHVPLEEPEHGGAGVQGEHHQQDLAESVEVDSLTGRDIDPAQQVGDRS